MIKPEIVQIKTKDKLQLPGLLFRAGRSRRIVIFLHGNGSSSVFYQDGRTWEIQEILAGAGYSSLLFNNRGAHYIKRLNVGRKRRRFGMAYEKIKDCVKDIDAAIAFLRRQGYKEFYLAGYSTGANKICVYHYYRRRNPVRKYILLGGGDDTGIYYQALGRKKFWRLLKQAKRNIQRGRGGDIIKEILPELLFSWQGFYDIANPDGDYNVFPFYEVMRKVSISQKRLFRHFRLLDKPTLVVYGSQDQFAWGHVPRCVEILKQQKPELDYRIIQGADHSFLNRQRQLANLMLKWLQR